MKNYFLIRYPTIVVVFWITLGVSMWATFVTDVPVVLSTIYIAGLIGISIGVTTYLGNVLLLRALEKEKLRPFFYQFVFFTLLLGLMFTLYTWGIFKAVSYGWIEYGRLFDKDEFFFGAMYTQLLCSAVLVNSGYCGLCFYRAYSIMFAKHAKLKQAHLEDQLRLLQDQINPHFMFNVLNHIHVLMKRNVELADELLISFSDILRYQLYECNKNTVLLEQEILFLQNVIEVEKMRWQNELKVTCHWEVEDKEKEISPLLLIPLVENAFKYVSRLPAEDGYVSIKLVQKDDHLSFEVENSKSAQSVAHREHSGIGLDNVRKRLDILYPSRHVLEVYDAETVFRIILQITLHKEDKYD